MQGTAADIIKQAMIDIDHWLSTGVLDARMVLQVHDEVLVESPLNEVEVVDALVLQIMEQATKLDVPLAVNSAWGSTWAEAKS
jgi:DNA polymerase-1